MEWGYPWGKSLGLFLFLLYITINKTVYSRTSHKRSPRISGRFREVAVYKNRTDVDRWSLMGEGRLREVVAHIGSTVLLFSLPTIYVVDTTSYNQEW